MFERFRHRGTGAVADRPGATEDRTTTRGGVVRGGDGTSIADRTAVDDRPARTRPAAATTTGGVPTAEALRAARARQREEFGGVNWGAAFFGWLVAVGVGVLLVALLAAAGAAIGLTQLSDAQARQNADSIGIGGAIALLVALMVAYYAGGYVAGRMSRFDGGRQGAGAWLIGLLVTVVLAVAGVLLGDQYNVLNQLNLPAVPVGKATLASGGAITLAAIVLGTLLAALVGGKAGERYHRRVDRVGFTD